MKIIKGTNGYDTITPMGDILFFSNEFGFPTNEDIDRAILNIEALRQLEEVARATEVSKEEFLVQLEAEVRSLQVIKDTIVDDVTTLQIDKENLLQEKEALIRERDVLIREIGREVEVIL